MAGLLPPAPMPCRGAKHSGAWIDVEQLHRLAAAPAAEQRTAAGEGQARVRCRQPRRGSRPARQPGGAIKPVGMAEEHQHEQKKRRVGQVLDQAVQGQQQQIADQAAKHASRLPFLPHQRTPARNWASPAAAIAQQSLSRCCQQPERAISHACSSKSGRWSGVRTSGPPSDSAHPGRNERSACQPDLTRVIDMGSALGGSTTEAVVSRVITGSGICCRNALAFWARVKLASVRPWSGTEAEQVIGSAISCPGQPLACSWSHRSR